MQARLRAQLGDRSKYSGERRRRSVVVASIVLTITDPLRGSYPLLCNLQAALIRSCGASFACMELTIISRFQRLQASTKYLLHSLFYSFSVLSKYRVPTMQNRFGKFDTTSFQEIILSSGVFRRETARGFYPWGNVVSPRKRVAEGLCGWRHGNSFPMTQSAQSLRQMRSIPHCSKAVFYVFVFYSIHNSATLHNLSPGIFH